MSIFSIKNKFYAFLFSLLLLSIQVNASESEHINLNEVMANIQHFYVDDVDLNKLNRHAIDSLMKQLDPHSAFLSASDLENLFNVANGRYTGLGIEVEVREEHIVIIESLDNSPAQQAGLIQGDVLLAVNGHSVLNQPIKSVAKLINQSNQGNISLSIARSGYDSPLSFELQRQKIDVSSVKTHLNPNGYGYMRIISFNNHTYHDVARHLAKLTQQSGDALSGLIIDLRDNPGGILDSAIEVSDLFLQKGTIVTTKGRFNDANHAYYAHEGDVLEGAPIVVLINSGSASAAEILAGALRDNNRATLVGTRSYGKGSVQSLIPLGDGQTALKLTTAKYYTPSGNSIDGVGIIPDFPISQIKIDKKNKLALLKLSQGESGNVFSPQFRDMQLEKAQQLLEK